MNVNPAGSVALTPGLHSSLCCLPSVAVTLLVTDGGSRVVWDFSDLFLMYNCMYTYLCSYTPVLGAGHFTLMETYVDSETL